MEQRRTARKSENCRNTYSSYRKQMFSEEEEGRRSARPRGGGGCSVLKTGCRSRTVGASRGKEGDLIRDNRQNNTNSTNTES